MNKRRKEKLSTRARQYAKAYDVTTFAMGQECAARSFEDGYRAAMRDARKAFNATPGCCAITMSEFLRPLR